MAFQVSKTFFDDFRQGGDAGADLFRRYRDKREPQLVFLRIHAVENGARHEGDVVGDRLLPEFVSLEPLKSF